MRKYFVYLFLSCLMSSFLFLGCTDTTSNTKTSDSEKSTSQAQASVKSKSTVQLDTDKDKASYGVGVSLGKKVAATSHLEYLDEEILLEAIRDVVLGKDILLTDEESESAMAVYVETISTEIKNKNTKASEQFLAKNRKKAGVVTLDSGIQYEMIKEGKGAKPVLEDKVIVHNITTNMKGDTVYNTYDGVAQEFYVNESIPAWKEILPLMSPQSKWRVSVPADLAYGEKGYQKMIEPFEAVVFEIELLIVNRSN